jgi:hypothetical protein
VVIEVTSETALSRGDPLTKPPGGNFQEGEMNQKQSTYRCSNRFSLLSVEQRLYGENNLNQ